MRSAGVTLVELVVSVCILGFVIGCIIALLPFSHVFNRKAWNANTASDLAASQLSQVRALPFASLPASLGPVIARDRGTDYTCSTTVVPYHGYAAMKLATVTVTWDQSGGKQTRILQSLVPQLDGP